MSATKLEQQAIEEARLELIARISPQLQARAEILAVITELQGQVDAIETAIKNDMALEGHYKLEVDGYPINYTLNIPGRETLDKMELASLGVSTEIIKKATKQGKSYDRFTIGKAKS